MSQRTNIITINITSARTTHTTYTLSVAFCSELILALSQPTPSLQAVMVASSSNKTQQQLPIPPPPQTLHPDDAKSTREWLFAQIVPEKKQQTPQPKAAARSEEEIKAAKAAKRRRQREGKKAAATAAASGDDKADDEPEPNDPMGKPDPGSSAAGGSGGSGGKGEDSSASSEVPMVKAPAVKETPEPGSSAAGGSGSIGTGSYGADDDDKPKHQLDCNNARVCGSTNLLWSQFLLDSPDASMDGRIWGLCFDCSGMDAKTFKRECRSRREGRAKLMRGRRDRPVASGSATWRKSSSRWSRRRATRCSATLRSSGPGRWQWRGWRASIS